MRIFEHISFYSDLDLITLSNNLERVLLLKLFEYDGKNDNRWSLTYKIAGEVYYHSGNHHAEYVKKLLTVTP